MKVALEWEAAAQKSQRRELTATQARRVLAEMVEFSTGEALHAYTLSAWFAEWLAMKGASASKGTLTRYEQVCRDFEAFLGSRANAPLQAITPTDIRKFRDKLHAEGRAPRTVNITVRKILNVPFEAARKRGYITNNPTFGVDEIKPRGAEAKAHREPFAPDEIDALLAVAGNEWRGAIIIGATTGLRLGDVARLTWGCLSADGKTLTVETRKTGKTVILPVHPDLTAWLKKQPRGIGNAYMLPSLADQTTGGKHGLSLQFRRLMDAAGITAKVIHRQGAGRTTSSKSFHSLRHTFVSGLANADVPADVRQRLAGHADDKTHQRYTHHELETLRAAIAKLPRHKSA